MHKKYINIWSLSGDSLSALRAMGFNFWLVEYLGKKLPRLGWKIYEDALTL